MVADAIPDPPGGRFGWNDAGDTPNMCITTFDWGGVPVLFETRNLWVKPDLNAAPNFNGSRVGVIVTCEDGEFRGGRGGGIVYDNKGKKMKPFKGDGGFDHFPAFIRAVNSRKEKDVAGLPHIQQDGAVVAHQRRVVCVDRVERQIGVRLELDHFGS